MVRIEICESLRLEIKRIFKEKSRDIFKLMLSLRENPKKGKEISSVGNVLIKELKYGTYRFNYITEGYNLKFLKLDELKDILLKFIRMSKKKDQQKTIEEIKALLKKLGYGGFK
jgi:hypothetical protein